MARDGETILVRQEETTKLRIPALNIESVVCFGYPGISPALMRLCVERNISVSFLNEYGKFLARVSGPVRGNVMLRRQQFFAAENEEVAAFVAQNVVTGKVLNCRAVLHRGHRDHGDKINKSAVLETMALLKNSGNQLQSSISVDSIRGIEGEAAMQYFGALDHLILMQKEQFFMKKRSRRPPMDHFNALISFLYGLLYADLTAALETVGLDPAIGFLHRYRSGRNSLALDLMEELRPYLSDRLALTLINRKQIQASDFSVKETGAVLLSEDGRKKVLQAHQKRKQEIITHPYISEKMEIGLLPFVQSMLLARYLRGDLEAYPPFLSQNL